MAVLCCCTLDEPTDQQSRVTFVRVFATSRNQLLANASWFRIVMWYFFFVFRVKKIRFLETGILNASNQNPESENLAMTYNKVFKQFKRRERNRCKNKTHDFDKSTPFNGYAYNYKIMSFHEYNFHLIKPLALLDPLISDWYDIIRLFRRIYYRKKKEKEEVSRRFIQQNVTAKYSISHRVRREIWSHGAMNLTTIFTSSRCTSVGSSFGEKSEATERNLIN